MFHLLFAQNIDNNLRGVMSVYLTTHNYSDEAANVVSEAQDRTKEIGHTVTGTPLIFASLVKEGDVSTLLASRFGVRYSKVVEIIDLMEQPIPRSIGFKANFTPDGFHVLDKARELAREYPFGYGTASTWHLMLALLRVADTQFVTLANRLDLLLDDVEQAVMAELSERMQTNTMVSQ